LNCKITNNEERALAYRKEANAEDKFIDDDPIYGNSTSTDSCLHDAIVLSVASRGLSGYIKGYSNSTNIEFDTFTTTKKKSQDIERFWNKIVDIDTPTVVSVSYNFENKDVKSYEDISSAVLYNKNKIMRSNTPVGTSNQQKLFEHDNKVLILFALANDATDQSQDLTDESKNIMAITHALNLQGTNNLIYVSATNPTFVDNKLSYTKTRSYMTDYVSILSAGYDIIPDYQPDNKDNPIGLTLTDNQTSVATPLLGVIAQNIWSIFPSLNSSDIKEIIYKSADQTNTQQVGSIVNAEDAYRMAFEYLLVDMMKSQYPVCRKASVVYSNKDKSNFSDKYSEIDCTNTAGDEPKGSYSMKNIEYSSKKGNTVVINIKTKENDIQPQKIKIKVEDIDYGTDTIKVQFTKVFESADYNDVTVKIAEWDYSKKNGPVLAREYPIITK
jgi:hypothetical protein